MAVKAVRGAIQVSANNEEAVDDGVITLVKSLLEVNNIEIDRIISIIFSQTHDLDVKNPAASLRKIGFSDIPLFCTQEPDVKGSMERVIRILVTVETSGKLKPVYLGGARFLRRDLTEE